MSSSPFIPKLNSNPNQDFLRKDEKKDSLVVGLHNIAQVLLLGLFFLLPLFFMPKLWATIGFDKVILCLLISTAIIVLIGFTSLRKTRIKTVLPFSLGLFWPLVLVALVSGLYSGDTLDALQGSFFEVQTVGFLAVIGLVMTIPLVLQGSRAKALNAIFLFFLSSSILLIYCLVRILFGADILSFGSFNAVTISPVGNYNDMAILAGLTIILSLISLVLLQFKVWWRWFFSVIILVALFLLAVVNFYSLWLAVGFFSLLVFIFLLSRDVLFQPNEETTSIKNSKLVIFVTLLVCLASATFVFAGDYANKLITKNVQVDYTEVIPSIKGTIGITRNVYQDSALLGIGPNRFADAWRMYKDPSINETIFWDTDFTNGSGFVPTLFVNTGLVGGILIILFHLGFLYTGYRMFIRGSERDPYWFYIGVTSFASACFIWGMSYVYQSGATILFIGALFTGLTFVASGVLVPDSVKTVRLVVSRQRGFLLMSLFIIVIASTFVFLLSVGKQYVAEYTFNKAEVTAKSIEEFERIASEAFLLYPDDRFVSTRAQIKLSEVNALLTKSDPTEEETQRFRSNIEQAQILVKEALSKDITNPDNHIILAGIYSSLSVAGIDGAKERALASLSEAERLDPINPGYHLIAAQMAARSGDLELARSKIIDSLRLKTNYTEALYLSAQLDIKEGDVESALATVRSIISLEPRNPTRYFQLGTLLYSQSKNEEAIEVFKTAVQLDPQYANARYLLALNYLAVNRLSEALSELRLVAETNPENAQLQELISKVESGDVTVIPGLGFDTPVSEVSPIENSMNDEAGRRAGETDLVSPVNIVSDREDDVTLAENENGEESSGVVVSEIPNEVVE
jgi:tetratricopeptide (TPR) repeat protein